MVELVAPGEARASDVFFAVVLKESLRDAQDSLDPISQKCIESRVNTQ